MKPNISILVCATILAAGLSPVCGQVSFAPHVDYVAGSQPEMTAIWDFEFDGDLDAAVTSDVPDKITIHTNNGAGILALTQTVLLANGSSPHYVVAGDFDGDFDVDLAVTLKNANAVTLVLNNGGSFTASGVLYSVGGNPRSLIAINIDGDGDIDLVSSNRDSNTLSVLRNNGNGTFQPAVHVAVGLDPRHLTAGDLDLDGDFDIAVANNDSNDISILLNNGTGTFGVAMTLSTGTFDSEGIVLGDLDGDHDLDIAATGHDNTPAQGVVLIFIRQATGFLPFVAYPNGGVEPDFIATDDLDLDGDFDLTTVNKSSNSLSVLVNSGAGTFGAPTIIPIGAGPDHVISGDLDGDQVADLVATNSNGTTFSVIRNLAQNGTLSLLGPAAVGTSVGMAVSSPSDPQNFYVCAFSFGRNPGLILPDRRHVPLNFDMLLEFSMLPNNGVFVNNAGLLNAAGAAVVTIAVPNMPALVGQSIYAACAILNPVASYNLEQTFGSLQITFQ